MPSEFQTPDNTLKPNKGSLFSYVNNAQVGIIIVAALIFGGGFIALENYVVTLVQAHAPYAKEQMFIKEKLNTHDASIEKITEDLATIKTDVGVIRHILEK